MRHVVARGHHHASATGTGTSHGSHSHHSGSSSGIMHTPGPAPVDQALYQMNPYGYAAHPTAGLDAGDVYGGGGGYETHHGHHSPYAAAYYDFDAAGDGSHGM